MTKRLKTFIAHCTFTGSDKGTKQVKVKALNIRAAYRLASQQNPDAKSIEINGITFQN